MISKKAYRIKKARFQKNYYATLKMAAQADELEESGVRATKKRAPFPLLKNLIIGIGITLASTISTQKIWDIVSVSELAEKVTGMKTTALKYQKELDELFEKEMLLKSLKEQREALKEQLEKLIDKKKLLDTLKEQFGGKNVTKILKREVPLTEEAFEKSQKINEIEEKLSKLKASTLYQRNKLRREEIAEDLLNMQKPWTEIYPKYKKEVLKKDVTTLFVAVTCLAVTVLVILVRKKKHESGLGWVDFIKSIYKKYKGKVMTLVNKILRRPDAETETVVSASIKPDGSLDKRALGNFIESKLRREL